MQETQETQVQPQGPEDPLEKETATHSSILAGTEERGGLHSHGQKNVMAYSLRSCKELDMTEHPAME